MNRQLGNLLVEDGCLNCNNLLMKIETGRCGCDDGASQLITCQGTTQRLTSKGDTKSYIKGISQAERSWLARHGKRVLDVQKPYGYSNVEAPLRNLKVAMDALVREGEKLCLATKGISNNAKVRSRKSKRKNAKITLQVTVNDLEKSMAVLKESRKASWQKADNFVILGTLDGSLNNGAIAGWIEKRAGLR